MLTITGHRAELSGEMPVRVVWHSYASLDTGQPVPSLPWDLSPIPRYWIRGQQNYEIHDHDHYELVIVLGGQGTLLTGAGPRPLGAGSVHVTAPGEQHGYEAMDGVDLAVCSYFGEWMLNSVDELLTVPGVLPLFLWRAVYDVGARPVVPEWTADPASLALCVRELADVAAESLRPQPSLMYLKSTMKRLMVHLSRSFEQTGLQSALVLDEVLHEALLHIEQALLESTPFQVSCVADACGLTRGGFAGAFKRAFGTSPMKYYQRRRIQRASWLLLQSRHTVTEIASQLCYTDAAHFTHVFKREQGMTPREYRRRHGVEIREM